MDTPANTKRIPDDEPYNRLAGALRLLALYVAVAVLLYFSQPNLWSVAVGAVLVVLGESVRFWAAGHLYKTQLLITSGPYRYTRNPLYLGRLLIFTGLAIMVNLPWYGSWIAVALVWIWFFGIYLRRKEKVEPARLERAHGEPYQRYFEAVPALFPRLRPWPEGSQDRWMASRMARNREYWMVIGLALVIAFLAWRALG